MMMQVVQAGTGRRAALDNIEVAGKTGTTNGYKDAWFIGYTGNYVAAIWFGNDDDTPMDNMTGGTLPAGTWHDVMAYAEEGIELKPLPGRPAPANAVISVLPAGSGGTNVPRPPTLSANTAATIRAIAETITEAQRRRGDALPSAESENRPEQPSSAATKSLARSGG